MKLIEITKIDPKRGRMVKKYLNQHGRTWQTKMDGNRPKNRKQ
jgi:hypothetical protein